jgi:hypothetical protein
LAIEQNETDDVAAELDFIEIALLAQSQPANESGNVPTQLDFVVAMALSSV